MVHIIHIFHRQNVTASINVSCKTLMKSMKNMKLQKQLYFKQNSNERP